MFKVTPNPPNTGPVPFDASFNLDPEKMKAAADRALKFYLDPGATKTQIPPRRSGTFYTIDAAVDHEALLAEVYESLSSARAMVNDLVELSEGPRRQTMLVLHRSLVMGEMAANRMLDNHTPV
ncbi:DUF6124 family protein [Pseudomonas nunensis]|uniref:DUF6124 family protein n=1 Tax=Pseudomonas nunensis TaxID=2961896 RepID=A0ABY5EM91_9PSED|nr:DUF6124 family protein [Pseudomonas nunensis]KOY00297.1 hypothetical protein AM274_21075 [Pseudomonas nunensis]KPN87474.1 hypothetical protein AL066_31660 [Pseudomonas nunensis]MCL5227269.1 DUF6124 family protein [Pseudomonas nunensis]UTO15800.1 DUF6124 family protein [Pseudomonas nunensis]